MHEFNPQAPSLFSSRGDEDHPAQPRPVLQPQTPSHPSPLAPDADLSRQVLPISADSVFSPPQRALATGANGTSCTTATSEILDLSGPVSDPGDTADAAAGSFRTALPGLRTSCPEIMSSSPRTNGNGQHHGAASTLAAPAAAVDFPAVRNGAATCAAATCAAAAPAAAASVSTASVPPAAPATAADIDPPLTVVPEHVAIIMDGNGRWAKNRGMMRVAGHRNGVDAVRACVRAAGEFGVKYLTLYAFSVENWRRPKAETTALMLLLEEFLRAELAELMSNNVRLQAIGRLSDLPESVRTCLNECIAATSANTGITLILALSYSGRVEIIEAVRSIAADVRSGLLNPDAITDAVLENHLYTSAYPDPDLLIRTSGEMRLSNFLLWQLSYTEIHVTSTLWPDFRREQFVIALQDFASRQRRYGAV